MCLSGLVSSAVIFYHLCDVWKVLILLVGGNDLLGYGYGPNRAKAKEAACLQAIETLTHFY
jgi:hypothetical protein